MHGPAAGIGLSFVLSCDLAIATDAAHFTAAYTGIGLSPDGGQTWHLPRIVGVRRATELLLTNRRVGADEAAEWGIVNEVVAVRRAGRARARAGRAVRRRAAAVQRGGQAPRRRSSATNSFGEHLEAEAASISFLAESPTGREGAAAFLEKRPPAYP